MADARRDLGWSRARGESGDGARRARRQAARRTSRWFATRAPDLQIASVSAPHHRQAALHVGDVRMLAAIAKVPRDRGEVRMAAQKRELFLVPASPLDEVTS